MDGITKGFVIAATIAVIAVSAFYIKTHTASGCFLGVCGIVTTK